VKIGIEDDDEEEENEEVKKDDVGVAVPVIALGQNLA